MSHLVEKRADEYRLHLAGFDDPCIAYAKQVGGDASDESEGWRIHPEGIAEHLDGFVVGNEVDALAVLKVIGHTYEAGGGGLQ